MYSTFKSHKGLDNRYLCNHWVQSSNPLKRRCTGWSLRNMENKARGHPHMTSEPCLDIWSLALYTYSFMNPALHPFKFQVPLSAHSHPPPPTTDVIYRRPQQGISPARRSNPPVSNRSAECGKGHLNSVQLRILLCMEDIESWGCVDLTPRTGES